MSDFLRQSLSPEVIRLNIKANCKEEIIREMVDIVVQAGLVSDKEAAEKAVFDREEMMSTGMEHGIAIPHGKTDSVEKLICAIATKPEGVDFACADGNPAKIFIMTLSPKSRVGPHIRFLAEVSNLLKNSERREQLLACKSPQEIYNMFVTA